MHAAYGRIGSQAVVGLEGIGYDAARGHFRTPLLRQPGGVWTET
jgi:hypothetical protein